MTRRTGDMHTNVSVCITCVLVTSAQAASMCGHQLHAVSMSACSTCVSMSVTHIASVHAGDNAFDYLIEGAKVTAVDFNGAQIALTEVKAAACRLLTFEDFFQIFAKNDMALFRRHYYQTLRQELTRPSAAFWDSKINKIKTIMYSGTSGVLAWFVCRGLFSALGLGFIRKTLVEQGSNEKFVQECMRHKRRLAVFCWVVDKIISNLGGAMMAGVPSRQLELGLHRPDNFQTIFKRILSTNMVPHCTPRIHSGLPRACKVSMCPNKHTCSYRFTGNHACLAELCWAVCA